MGFTGMISLGLYRLIVGPSSHKTLLLNATDLIYHLQTLYVRSIQMGTGPFFQISLSKLYRILNDLLMIFKE